MRPNTAPVISARDRTVLSGRSNLSRLAEPRRPRSQNAILLGSGGVVEAGFGGTAQQQQRRRPETPFTRPATPSHRDLPVFLHAMESNRSERARQKKKKAEDRKVRQDQKKNDEHLKGFIKRNKDEMWEYVPSLYHTQREEHHHLSEEVITEKVKEFCRTTYGGNLTHMLTTFENKELVERLGGSHNMRRTIAPTVRMDVPTSLKMQSPALYMDGYQTDRRRYDARIKRLFLQPLEKYMRSTNGGFASTQYRRTKRSTTVDSNPMCVPGHGGRTNVSNPHLQTLMDNLPECCRINFELDLTPLSSLPFKLAGWADVNSHEGNNVRPSFLRGGAFAQSHQQF